MNDILRLCPLFEGLTDAEITDALAFYRAESREYARGEFLLRAGDAVKRFGLVVRGAVQILMDDLDGRHMIMATVAPGQTFGESLCYREIADCPVYACAVDACAVVWLRADGLKSGPGHCAHCQRFIRMLTLKTLSMNDRIQVLSKPTLREKLMTLFTQSSARAGRNFSLPFNRSDMAAYLGVNRSALSRELSKLKNEGKIDFYKNSFTIRDGN